jgi:hypothetical protein
MTYLEAPLRQPLGKQFLGYDVPTEFRPVEKIIIESQATGWEHLIGFFIYAANQESFTEDDIQQPLLYIFSMIRPNESEQKRIWNITKEQLFLLPQGPKVWEYITKIRPDLT